MKHVTSLISRVVGAGSGLRAAANQWPGDIETWREAGGSHISVVTMGANLNTLDGHIEAIKRWRDVYNRTAKHDRRHRCSSPSPKTPTGTPSGRLWSSGSRSGEYAKAEGIENRPAFREAFQRRRCLVPVDNFYEWKKTATGKQPYAIALADWGLMALAGLWENWRSPPGEWVRSFAIITTTSNELCAELHNRMPVVLGPETWPAWLGEEPADARQLKASFGVATIMAKLHTHSQSPPRSRRRQRLSVQRDVLRRAVFNPGFGGYVGEFGADADV